jgi:DNA-binding transcriptional ArsR family regulator
MSDESGRRGRGTYRPEGSEEVDTLFDLLRDPARRLVLTRLQEDGRTSVERLLQDRRGRGEDWRTFEIGLHHVHLPRLERTGLIEYDERSGEIVGREWPAGLDRLLAVARELESGVLAEGSETV